MPEAWCSGLSQQDEERIKRAVECTCELCCEYKPVSLLTLHGITPGAREPDPNPKDRERNILVVCTDCHRHIHRLPVAKKKLKALIARRRFMKRKEILRALGYIPKPVSPPEDQDFARIYEDSFKSPSAHFR